MTNYYYYYHFLIVKMNTSHNSEIHTLVSVFFLFAFFISSHFYTHIFFLSKKILSFAFDICIYL